MQEPRRGRFGSGRKHGNSSGCEASCQSPEPSIPPHSRLRRRTSFLVAPSKTAVPRPPRNPAAPPGAGTCRGPSTFARSRAMHHTGPSGNSWQNRGLRDVLRPACRQQTLPRHQSFSRSASGKRLLHLPSSPDFCRTANACTAGRSRPAFHLRPGRCPALAVRALAMRVCQSRPVDGSAV